MGRKPRRLPSRLASDPGQYDRILYFWTVLSTQDSSGSWVSVILSSDHNGMNSVEAARIRKEHPGEHQCVWNGRVLGAIAVTRGIRPSIVAL